MAVLVRIWHSPTAATFASAASRTLGGLIVMLLVMAHLGAAGVAIWFLFRIVTGLTVLGQLGFQPTFIRVIAYAAGGGSGPAGDISVVQRDCGAGRDWERVEAICRTMNVVYLVLSALAVATLCTVGTWAFMRPISELENPTTGWICWGLVVFSCGVVFRGNGYSAYLQGLNHIALFQRWESVTALGVAITCAAVLLVGGGLLELVFVEQLWRVLTVVRNRWLCGRIEQGRYSGFKGYKIDSDVFKLVWPASWRSSLGLMSVSALIPLSGLVYAQTAPPEEVAAYLLAIRLFQVLTQLSVAPLGSKLPLLAGLYAEGRIEEVIVVARRGMRIALWLFALGFAALGLMGSPLLVWLNSSSPFPSQELWSLLGIGFWLERFGAMHLQLYSTTNKIVWHIAGGGFGAIYIGLSALLLPTLGVYAFAIGMLAGYLGFYSWYCARHSYRAFGLRFWQFEGSVSLPSLALLLAYALGGELLG